MPEAAQTVAPTTPAPQATPTPTTPESPTSTRTYPEPFQAETSVVPADPNPSELAKAPDPRDASVEVKPVTFEELKLPSNIKAEGVAPFLDIINNKEMTPQGRSQALLELYQEESKKVMQAPAQAYKAQNDKWREAMKADPEIGGSKLYDTVIPAATRMITQFGGVEFRKALDLTGMGNHPEMARFLFKVASALGEGSHVGGSPPSEPAKRPSAAEALYPSLVKGN
jgi:hypothetical protein